MNLFHRVVSTMAAIGVFLSVAFPDLTSRFSLFGISITAYLVVGFAALFSIGLSVNSLHLFRTRNTSDRAQQGKLERMRFTFIGTTAVTGVAFGVVQVVHGMFRIAEPQALQGVISSLLLLAGTSYFVTVKQTPEKLIQVIVWSGATSATLAILDELFQWAVFGGRHMAMALLIPLSLSIVRFRSAPAHFVFPLLIFTGIAITGSRSATAVALLLFLTYLIVFRETRIQIRLLLAASAFTIFTVFLLASPMVQDRFVNPGDQALIIRLETPSIDGGDNTSVIDNPRSLSLVINTNGRLNVWSELVEEVLQGRPLLGGGAGFAGQFVSDRFNWDHPHNEYLRIFADFGAIGLSFALIILGSLTFFFGRHDPRKSRPAFLGIALLLSLSLLSITDLPLVSVGFVLPLSIAVGFAIRGSGEINPPIPISSHEECQ